MARTRPPLLDSRMPAKKSIPISRDLARIIKESSKLEAGTVSEQLRAVEDRQCQALEFYLRACALRLDKKEF